MPATTLSHPIADAVAPLKQAAVERARSLTKDHLTNLADDLVGKNLRDEAPFPRSSMSRADYLSAKARHSLVRRITLYVRQGHHVGADEIATAVNAAEIQGMADQAALDAADSFDAYVAKLIAKVGDVDSASVCGANLWLGSTLTVSKAGTVERWHTQQIINISVLGNLFNQWPTRKMK